jgi:hypothetical protein
MNAWYFNILGIKKRPIFIQNLDQIYESWKIYADNGGKIVFPAHGKPFNVQKLTTRYTKKI